jgi:hypothetical protein
MSVNNESVNDTTCWSADYHGSAVLGSIGAGANVGRRAALSAPRQVIVRFTNSIIMVTVAVNATYQFRHQGFQKRSNGTYPARH